jgi:hypothetical protein
MATDAPLSKQSATVAYTGTELTKEGDTLYSFRVSNTSRRGLFFFGYGSAAPIYKSQTLTWFRWRDASPFQCGTGSAIQRIAPGRSFVFTAYQGSRFWPWRAGVFLMPSLANAKLAEEAEADGLGTMIWSSTIR